MGILVKTPVVVAITNGAYAALTVPSGIAFQSVMMQSRSGTTWYLSDVLAGTTYATVLGTSAFFYDFDCRHTGSIAVIIGYALSSAASDNIELVLGG